MKAAQCSVTPIIPGIQAPPFAPGPAAPPFSQHFSVSECLSRACLGKSIVSFPVRTSGASQKQQRFRTSKASVVLNDWRLLPRIGAIKGEQPVPGTVGIHRCRQQTAPLSLSFP